ncbi:M20/M25/M40 family metallo-hydrolase [Peribacillus asahii]|uniref:M20/M25/M40 family metallo-hydrolase n=1 Tax=Peribacillus asahii TaxID=228899 RepID=UPI002079B0B0|nr:M20/M25/M40 family metallo-hydrolase [Peribacillus asahii]USK71245.1 M20/M25/M40 family metallo-hydrolase [Peribacillus asahii]
MKNWNQLFVRHGWLLNKKEENIFDCRYETEINQQFLLQSLEQAHLSYEYYEKTLVMHSQPIEEEDWISILDFQYRGHGGDLWFRPGQEEPKVRELDTYICGIVRQFNRLGFYTNGSCDGHGRNSASVSIVKKEKDIEQLVQMLLALGMKRVHYRENPQSYVISFPLKSTELLDLAEKISVVQEEWLEKGLDYIKEQLFYSQLEELLSISGESGNEGRIRDVVQEKLTPYVDFITVDRHGNLLAEKTYKSGHGPTILLSAHLDTVEEVVENRSIVKENGIWWSSEGILGADDRAGVTVLLNIAETLYQSPTFSGKIKFIFTVEEEIGLVGARNVDDYFLWGTDAAIVVDRRGTQDIVTSCGGYIPFCDEAYGEFIEEVAKEAGLSGWKCTQGGSSDTKIWAEHGIQSVNLSVGYNYEHTDAEYLDIQACYCTVQLIQMFLGKGQELRRLLNGMRRKKMFHVN